jgi:hypothetical protein
LYFWTICAFEPVMPKVYRSMKKAEDGKPVVDASGKGLGVSPYVESIRGLLQLHHLATIGKDDSPEADAIRNTLERPWAELTDTEKKRITGLSEDLYSISAPNRDPDPLNAEAERELNEFADACQSADWDKALELLRRCDHYLPLADASYRREFVWQEAGDRDTAAVFFEHAAQLAGTAGRNGGSSHASG